MTTPKRKTKSAGPAAAKKGTPKTQSTAPASKTLSKDSSKKKATRPARGARKQASTGIFAKAADAILEVIGATVAGAASGAVEGAIIAGGKAIGIKPKSEIVDKKK